jgi:hypothetical protein
MLKAAPRYEDAAPKAEPADTIPDMGIWDAGDDLEMPEPRHWLLGNQFCRKFLSGILSRRRRGADRCPMAPTQDLGRPGQCPAQCRPG